MSEIKYGDFKLGYISLQMNIKIPPPSMELAALEHLKNQCTMLITTLAPSF